MENCDAVMELRNVEELALPPDTVWHVQTTPLAQKLSARTEELDPIVISIRTIDLVSIFVVNPHAVNSVELPRFAAMSSPDRYPWTLHLIWKLLHNDPGALGLLAGNPFPDAPPRFIRAVLYEYRFAPPGSRGGAWWDRRPVGLWSPAVSADDPRLLRFLAASGWAKR